MFLLLFEVQTLLSNMAAITNGQIEGRAESFLLLPTKKAYFLISTVKSLLYSKIMQSHAVFTNSNEQIATRTFFLRLTVLTGKT